MSRLVTLRREYFLEDLPDIPHGVVIDAGANVGHFTRYAAERWPTLTRINCYEPNPETYRELAAGPLPDVAALFPYALVHPAEVSKRRLYLGVHEPGECSLRDDIVYPPDGTDPRPHVSQRLDAWVMVDTLDAAKLPPCDVLKLDTEGCEVEILTGYKHLAGVAVLLVEPHPVGGDLGAQVRAIVRLARAAGLRRLSGPILRFVR